MDRCRATLALAEESFTCATPGVEAALATWGMTKSLICRIFPKLEIPAGGDRTDPADSPDALRSLRLLALREADADRALRGVLDLDRADWEGEGE
mmetsp:Transcript_17632/g.38862  ORF Transcript_17632/g.38862 Transcript_17632/m.38862 type:complete len:95 (-) Transcript_17632:167-451(-)